MKIAMKVLTVYVFMISSVYGDEGFEQWLNRFYSTAAQNGITHATCIEAFSGVHEPDRDVLRKAAFQPEYTLEIWEYLDGRINSRTVANGMAAHKKYKDTLKAVESKMQVNEEILLAIWSMETGLGEVLTKRERLHYVPQALATLAYGDPKRKKFGETQLLAVLKIMQDKKIQKEQLIGSWAGAMGQTQFIPTSYLAYSVDFDGDGQADIWNSIADALATSANLLKKNGWNMQRRWGCEVSAPENAQNFAEQSRPYHEWIKLGFREVSSCKSVQDEDTLVLKMPAKNGGPSFLVGKNYSVVKKYNNSDAYAIAALLLADRLAGLPPPVKRWDRPADSVVFEEKVEIQNLLLEKKYYAGEADGFFGTASKDALKAYQRDKNLNQDGIPTKTILNLLKKS